MNDRELVTMIKDPSTPRVQKKKLEEQLRNRYELLVHKNWAVLRRQLNNSHIVLNLKDDYYSEAYIAFTKALKAIKLSKIEDDNWKFVGYYRFYLKNVRAVIIDRSLRIYKNEVSDTVMRVGNKDLSLLDKVDQYYLTNKQDPLKELLKKEEEERCDLAIKNCFEVWNDRRKYIFKRKQEGAINNEISKELGVNPAAITYYLKGMKEDIKKELYK